jgi:hypothetical protein
VIVAKRFDYKKLFIERRIKTMAAGGICSFTGRYCSDLGTTFCTDSCPNNPYVTDD